MLAFLAVFYSFSFPGLLSITANYGWPIRQNILAGGDPRSVPPELILDLESRKHPGHLKAELGYLQWINSSMFNKYSLLYKEIYYYCCTSKHESTN